MPDTINLIYSSISNGANLLVYQFFLRRFRDPIRVPRLRENYHRVLKIRENWVPRIREIASLQIHTGFLRFSLKKPWVYYIFILIIFRKQKKWF